jgi:hypothetical protein
MISWWNAAISGNGAWAREARRAMAAAGERQLTFSPESVISFDVRDLQALTLRLRQRRRFTLMLGRGNGADLPGRLG